MRFKPEGPFEHGRAPRVGVLLVNLGTPDAPDAASVRRYLREFLTDPRVIEIPSFIWRPLLETVVLPLRASRSAAKYEKVWMRDGSPLVVYTGRQAKLLRGRIGTRIKDILVEFGMRYGNPSIASALDRLHAQGAEKILVLPLYPQYAGATTGSSQDAVFRWCESTRNVPELRFLKHYHDHPAYISALAARFREFIGAERRVDPGQAFVKRTTVFSFHGLPKRSLLLGDPYHCECLKTGRLLAESLRLAESDYRITFQSRFGRAEWLQPYTEPTLVELARSGVKAVDVFCPGFPADCLETLEEIAIEAKAAFLAAGGEDYHYVPALNDDPRWIEALFGIAMEQMEGWQTRTEGPASRDAQKRRAIALGADT
jgi:protoporphyrin/coproporphyrin ferrochelatase